MAIVEYLANKKKLQNNLLEYIDGESEDIQYVKSNLFHYLGDPNEINKFELKEILIFISIFSNNHHRYSDFFQKIDEILLYFKPAIIRFFTNIEIFNIFNTNKRVLLSLFENEFIKPDEHLAKIIKKYEFRKYPEYFYIEFEQFYDQGLKSKIEEEIGLLDQNTIKIFNEKRRIGENDNYICELIRNDSVNEFIVLINKPETNKKNIPMSIFETNPCLLIDNVSLIDYAAFFGSIQIFEYLFFEKHQLSINSMVYSVHGNNPTLFHRIEEKTENKKDLPKYFQNALIEAINCHQNKYVDFICISLTTKIEENRNLISLCIKSFNFELFPENLSSNYNFYFLCQYNHFTFVDILLKTTSFDINEMVILNQKKFYSISKYFFFLISFQKNKLF